LERQTTHLTVGDHSHAGILLQADRRLDRCVFNPLELERTELATLQALSRLHKPARPEEATHDVSARRDHGANLREAHSHAAERGFNSPRTNRLTGMTVARNMLIVDVAEETVELSPTDWVQAQTSKILETGTTEGIEVLGSPIVLLTLRGAKTGKLRYTPVMRVEHEGRYAVVASKGGAPEHPSWYHNIKTYLELPLQDGTVTKNYVAREVKGAERPEWWERAVVAYPPYAEYQKKTDRQIPVFVLDST
jgi:deazaflavin-dependent oxidoreductase (nitroreductase family)